MKEAANTPLILSRDDLGKMRLIRHSHGRLTLALGDETIHDDVQVCRAAPLSDPDHYIAFRDDRGREICVVQNPNHLSQATQAVLKAALDQHYLISTITAVLSLRIESDVCYFDVATSRGRREFVIQNVQEGVRRVGERKVVLVDIDGNRFEIRDVDQLDRRSIALMKRIL